MRRRGAQLWTRAGFLAVAALAALLLIPSLEPVAWLLALLLVLTAAGTVGVSMRARNGGTRQRISHHGDRTGSTPA